MIVDLAYFRYFPGDHLKAKIGMSHEQKGIYGDLLDISWLQDPPGTLPTDHAEIARLVGIPLKRFATHVPIVLKAWKRQGKRLVHEWMEREYAKNLAYHTERSETGKKGVEAKRNKKLSLSSASAKLKPPSPSSSSHELRIGDYSSNPGDLNESVQFNNGTNPEMKTQPPPPPALGRGTVRDLFDKVFWPAYPRKEHKKQAWIVFELLGPGADLLREIMAFLESEKTDWENGRTCPLPDNFLKAREWKHVRPLPPKVKPGGIIVSDAIVPEPNEALTSNGAFLNKGRTYPRD